MVKGSPYPDLVIPEMSVHEYLLGKMEEYGDAVAMVDYPRAVTVTFSQVRERVIKCASALHKRGLQKGDVVAICATNRIEYPILMLAIAACGGISTGCNPQLTEAEILHQFRLSEPIMVFCETDVYPKIEKISNGTITVFTFGETTKGVSYHTLVHHHHGTASYPAVDVNPKEDVFIIAFSSGTTGLPKGVMLTHYNMMAEICIVQTTFFQSRNSCFHMVIPMFHIFGFSMTLIELALGVKNVFDSQFDAKRMFRAIEKHKVTHFATVPPVMLLLSRTILLRTYDVTSLQRMLCGAAPVTPGLISAICERYKVAASPCYGMTEIAPVSFGDPLVRELDSVGSICPNTIVKIVDPTTGKELEQGLNGEILAKGPHMMKGYLGNSEETSSTIDKDGWLHTGDLGHYDDSGMLYLVDRLKELIKYKTYQVPPAEVEKVLLNHPGILDAAVIGIPDRQAGEVPKAFVVRNDSSLTEEDVQKFAARDLADYKYLRGGVEFIDAIPKSASGKILRKDLRKRVPTPRRSRSRQKR